MASRINVPHLYELMGVEDFVQGQDQAVNVKRYIFLPTKVPYNVENAFLIDIWDHHQEINKCKSFNGTRRRRVQGE